MFVRVALLKTSANTSEDNSVVAKVGSDEVIPVAEVGQRVPLTTG